MFTNYDRFASHSVMIEDLGWEPLVEKRAMAKTIISYKILNELIDILHERSSQSNVNYTRSQRTFQQVKGAWGQGPLDF